MQFEKKTFQFLQDLENNNNRDWFAENKKVYDLSLNNAKELFTEINQNLELHDEIEKQKVYRIYRDVRFSKDKTPYNPRFAVSYSRKGKELRGGYFLQVKPGDTVLGGGFWQPEKEDLFRIRKEFELDASEIREILAEENFIKYFGGKLEGDELKTAPKGFDKEHESIDLIKKKGFVAIRRFTDKEVMSKNFLNEIDASFKTLRPYFNLMSDILTTNLNGESIL
ncbi:TIGR02453 family protein [Tenacibaculum sp. MAR_2010_89]|uniref:DUF2461 domain-containing protein n=1 Tax=Tenacibaculum sp. MAR_2010_89 TaxID=1250198 RepID=UPI000894E700|nr:DUF2461 domain-containing protein [Tenacibaculum sp. MAR_2010_89]SEE56652.1 TIGR02453 family protein [Tenacibaculum sp. MAR_2010_89]